MADHLNSQSSRRFIDLATRPLEANTELHLAAQNELAHLVDASPETTDSVLEDAAAKLELADRRIWRKWILPLLGAVALVSLAVVVATTAYRFIQFRGFIGMATSLYSGGENTALDRLAKKLPPDKRLLLFGDADAYNEAEKWQPLWESDRSNPAYLQAYAVGYLTDQQTLSVEILKESETIDPGNAYLPTLAAGSLASNSVERENRSFSARKSPEAPKWIISDQARFDEAYEALRKAAELPRFTDHSIALNQERFRHLPPGRDFLERTSVLTYTAGMTAPKIKLTSLTKLLAAKASTLDESADIAEFRECVRLWHWLVECSAGASWTLIDGLITKAIIQAPLKDFRDAAARLGLDDASRDFRMLDERLEAEKGQRKARSKEDHTTYLIETKGSIMARLQMPAVAHQVNSPPVSTEDDFKPGRLTDHALLGQAHATIAALCFGLLTLGALLSRMVIPQAFRSVACRLADLISLRDRMWLFGIGILGPVVLYFALIQIPILSAREWSMGLSNFIVPASQLAALTLLMINLTIALGARLTRKRLPMLATARRSWRRFLSWIGVISAVLALLLGGIGHVVLFKFGAVLFIFAACWPLAFWLPRIWQKSPTPNLRRVALHQVLAPLWAGAVIISCLLFAVHRSDELKWTARDRLLAPDPELRGMSHFEGVVAKQLNSEVRELMKDILPITIHAAEQPGPSR